MTLFLSIRNPAPDMPPPLPLDGRDVVLGRAAEVDWSIPDPRVSSRHLVIGYRDGGYLVRDTSSNGTAVNGRPLAGIHRLAPGDVMTIGGTDIVFGDAPAAAATGTRAPRLSAPADEGLAAALAAALASLLSTRRRQLGELGVTAPDGLAASPLAQGGDGAAIRLGALSPVAATAAIDAAAAAIERHHAASLAAMQASLREVLAEIAPDTLEALPALPAKGEARDAALWRAYVARFDGERLAGAGFVDRFAEAFRTNYTRLAKLG